MADTRPDSDSGSKPNPSEWLTVREAVRLHYENTPREKPIHRSAVYRWVDDPQHPVRGQWFAGELFVERASLLACCRDGVPRGRRRGARANTDAQVAATLDRIHRRHGVAVPARGGETE